MKKRIINQIFFDMDEVLYNLSDFVTLQINKEFHMNYPKGYNESYWWDMYKDSNGKIISRDYFEKLLQQKGLFYDGEPIDNAIETINKLHLDDYDIHILTRPQINEYCYYEKAMWIYKYFPWLDLNSHFHASGNKGLFANSNRILVDDDIIHLNDWKNNNGVSICFHYEWNKNWNGHKANNMEEVYQLIKNLSEI